MAPDGPEHSQPDTHTSPGPVAPPVLQQTHTVLSPDGDNAKSLKVSSTKRRKVIANGPSVAFTRRETRSRGVIPPPPPPKTRAPYRRKTADENKVAAKATRQKQLHDTYERHDSKVRELFHLTKFVTLVDYDAKAAKEEESEVFQEVTHF
jgi:hypothetical protein